MGSSTSGETIGSDSARVLTLAPLPVRSVHGESSTAPAGCGLPWAFKANRQASVRPPPAESPAITICLGSMPLACSRS